MCPTKDIRFAGVGPIFANLSSRNLSGVHRNHTGAKVSQRYLPRCDFLHQCSHPGFPIVWAKLCVRFMSFPSLSAIFFQYEMSLFKSRRRWTKGTRNKAYKISELVTRIQPCRFDQPLNAGAIWRPHERPIFPCQCQARRGYSAASKSINAKFRKSWERTWHCHICSTPKRKAFRTLYGWSRTQYWTPKIGVTAFLFWNVTGELAWSCYMLENCLVMQSMQHVK